MKGVIAWNGFGLFHSAMGLVILRILYHQWAQSSQDEKPFWTRRVVQKILGAVLGAYAFGVGVHLAIDVSQPKAVIFPLFGSLVDGTLIDDRIWLLGNSLWVFQVFGSVFALVFVEELDTAKRYVERTERKDV